VGTQWETLEDGKTSIVSYNGCSSFEKLFWGVDDAPYRHSSLYPYHESTPCGVSGCHYTSYVGLSTGKEKHKQSSNNFLSRWIKCWYCLDGVIRRPRKPNLETEEN
jgi:hypothetical protein